MGKITQKQKDKLKYLRIRKALKLATGPIIDGSINLCYGDPYYIYSLQQQYGSIEKMREWLKKYEERRIK